MADEEAEEGNEKGVAVMGSVRPLADSISAEEAERAAKLVRGAIDQHKRQLDDLKRFSTENRSLSELVLELPDSVSHRIMVPFGKAAFFPGRLIHTNEFLVLLGENHYAERSAKQTVEILDRRSEFLDRKIESSKAQIADLEAESSFVTATAEEAKAGLVEIREEYEGSGDRQTNQVSNQASTSSITEAASSQPKSVSLVGTASHLGASPATSSDITAEDREHDLLMARLSELELAEAAAGDDNESSDEEVSDNNNAGVSKPLGLDLSSNVVSREEKDLQEEEYDSEEMEEDNLSFSDDEEDYNEGVHRSSEDEIETEDDTEDDAEGDDQKSDLKDKEKGGPLLGKPLSRFAREVYAEKEASESQHALQRFIFQQGQPVQGELRSRANLDVSSSMPEKPENIQGFNDLQKELQEWRREGVYGKGLVPAERQVDEIKTVGSSVEGHSRVKTSSEPVASVMKAFTGKVTEHSHAEPTTFNAEQVQELQPSRPMSKFKMRQLQGGRQ